MTSNEYLVSILQKYQAKNLANYAYAISNLKATLRQWAGSYCIDIFTSGSIAKGTAISLASDVDFLVSLDNSCNQSNGGLKSIYDSLYHTLNGNYQNVRKQNVSIRIKLTNNAYLPSYVEVDITPARKQSGNTNDHSLWVSKLGTWKQTNIQRHINDIFKSGRANEIKLLKIWRERNALEFPSIYLEYLLTTLILFGKPKDAASLSDNFSHILRKLAEDENNNPLFMEIRDPANSSNRLSELLTIADKRQIMAKAQQALSLKFLEYIVY